MKYLTLNQAFSQAVGRENLTGIDVQNRMIMSQPSFSRKKRNPKTFTLDELLKIDALVHFTDEEILALFNRKRKRERSIEEDEEFRTY